MKKILFLLLILFCFSCGSSYQYRNWLEYNFPIKDENLLKQEINRVEKIYPFVFLMFHNDNENYVINIIPSSDNLKTKDVNYLKLKYAYRYVRIDKNYYPLVFLSDQQFGGIRKKEILPTGIEVVGYLRKWTIYDNALTLYFDKEWNFIKSKSLVKYN